MRVETTVPLNDWRKVPEVARRAEQAGFDGIVSAEIQNDPFVPLAFAALATERIQLGTAIAVAFPRSPMVVANVCWDLQTQSGGRFVLGLGTQVKGHNERRFSVPWSAARAAAPRVRRVAAGDLAHLADRRAPRLRGQALPLHVDDAGVLAAGERPAADPDHHRRGRPGHDEARGPRLRRRAPPRLRHPQVPGGGRDPPGRRGSARVGPRALELRVLGRRLHLHRRRRGRGAEADRRGALPRRLLRLDAQLPRRVRRARLGRPRHEAPPALEAGPLDRRWRRRCPTRWCAPSRPSAPTTSSPPAIEARFGGVTDSVALGFPGSTPAGLVGEVVQDVQRIACGFRGFPKS